MKFSGKSFLVDQCLLLWPGNDFTLSFSLQIISGKRERERERERRESLDRREREEEETSLAIAPFVDRTAHRSRLLSIDERARWTIALLVDWRAAWSTSGAIVDRDCKRARWSTSGTIDKRIDRPTSALVDRDRRSRRSSDDRTDVAFTARSHLLLRRAISI